MPPYLAGRLDDLLDGYERFIAYALVLLVVLLIVCTSNCIVVVALVDHHMWAIRNHRCRRSV